MWRICIIILFENEREKNNVYETIIILNDKLNCRIITKESEILASFRQASKMADVFARQKTRGPKSVLGRTKFVTRDDMLTYDRTLSSIIASKEFD